MKLRGYVALSVLCLGLLAADPVQRLVIAPWVKLRPGRRIPALGRWMHFMAWLVLTPVVRIGHATIPVPRRIVPAKPGNLILMNHQSVFDIPLVVQTVERGYPRIVTRKWYSRSIPLISHMVRLYQYPVVDAAANYTTLRETLDSLEEVGRATDVPIAVFPEGTRTREGEIGRFRLGGLSRLLAARDWDSVRLRCRRVLESREVRGPRRRDGRYRREVRTRRNAGVDGPDRRSRAVHRAGASDDGGSAG